MLQSVLDAMAGALVRPVGRCGAKLKGVAGYTGSGEARFSAWPDGHVMLIVDLRGVAGLKAEIWIDGQGFASLTGDRGQFTAKFDSRTGAPAAALAAGDRMEIRQNGNVILTGVLG